MNPKYSLNFRENWLKDMLTIIVFRSLAWRLCYLTIHDLSIHGPTMHDSCRNYPKMLKLYWENYVNICLRHPMDSDGVFINLLAFKYMLNIMNHYPLLSSDSSGTSHNKLKLNLERAVYEKRSVRGVLWKKLFKSLWKFTWKQ